MRVVRLLSLSSGAEAGASRRQSRSVKESRDVCESIKPVPVACALRFSAREAKSVCPV